MAESVNGEAPDDRSVVGEDVETESAAFDGGNCEDADIEEFIVMVQAIVEEFFAEKTIEPRDVDVERGQLLPSFFRLHVREE